MKPPVPTSGPDEIQDKAPPVGTLNSLPAASLGEVSCGEDDPLVSEPLSGRPEKNGDSTDQETIDNAMELLQAAGYFREQGDPDSAIEALDKAYAKLLEVDEEGDPELLQQKEDLRFTISKRIVEAYASRYRTANGLHKAIPLTMNRHVRKAIDLFTGSQRDFFLDAYKRSGLYRPFILEALREAGLPEELSWLPLIESGFKVKAFSRARALGLWQFIASTGYKYGLKRDRWVDERLDFKKSTMAAISYLRELHRMFGDWTTALAAYNCGEWAVLRRIRAQKINYLDNFWDLYQRLPQETAFYVPSLLAVLQIVSNPEAHGLKLPTPDEPMETETVVVSRQMALKEMGRLIGMDRTILADMNAALRRGVTPNSHYELTVPSGTGEVLLSKLDDIPAWRSPIPSYYIHKVRRGDTLSGIAHGYRASVTSIKAANGLKSDFLQAGARLKIPAARRGVASSPETAALQSDGLTGKVLTREVKRGDSLWKIAREYGTTTNLIVSLNQLRNTHLTVGQIIKVPSWSSESRPEKTMSYRVRQGDSPYLIARRHHMDLSELLSLNELTPRCRIYPGQKLLIRVD
ncbi:MAG: LysM peptidoglycan-binding domain-containing protein [Thermodesulfobacteriota bacterium]